MITERLQYRGYDITFDPTRPVTGTWRAERHGVGLCHNNLESVQRMIDTKIEEYRRRYGTAY